MTNSCYRDTDVCNIFKKLLLINFLIIKKKIQFLFCLLNKIVDFFFLLNRDNKSNLQYVQDYKPETSNIRYLRVLLYGPVGSGKSSFINSVCSVLRGRIMIPALTSATTSDRSFTTRVRKLQKHNFRSCSSLSCSFHVPWSRFFYEINIAFSREHFCF